MGTKFSVTVTAISDILNTKIEDGFAGAYHYQAEVSDPDNPGQMIPNPMSKAAFLQQQVEKYIIEVVSAYEAQAAGDASRSSTLADAKAALSDE